ncbi:2-polyprenyl-6-methoxyphenol hydroxylase-like FAD-dependent oxidoreductase [Streptomyces tendae]
MKNTQHETGTAAHAHRVVILGAGYAGMAAAVRLAARAKRRDDVDVTLVNAQERFTERMRLHMAATGRQLAELSIVDSWRARTHASYAAGWRPWTRTRRPYGSMTTRSCPTTRSCSASSRP